MKLLLLLALSLQIGWHLVESGRSPIRTSLPPAPSLAALHAASMGDPVALSKVVLLYVQAQDDAGTSLRSLDYPRLRDWLGRALDLDPRAQAPLLAASQVYGAVNDPARVRLMLDFVDQRFAEDPDRRWPWLAHAALVARHRLHDPPLARRYAQAVRQRALGPDVPAWARQLDLFMRDDENERDSERALIGARLHSNQVSDPRELHFLEQRLDSLDPRAH